MAPLPTDFPNYYALLGIEPQASSEEIKRAYKRLAQELHPDRGSADTRDGEGFKALNEAYQVLSNPTARAVYDRHRRSAGVTDGDRSTPAAAPPKGGSWGAFFRRLFGSGPAPEHGEDLSTSLRVELSDLLSRSRMQIELASTRVCPACQGAGLQPVGQDADPEACPACGGRGRQPARNKLEVTLPAGLADGAQVKIAGEGEPGLRGGRDGDLFLNIQVARHPLLERRETDLHLTVPLSPSQAIDGGQVEIPGLGGVLVLAIPAGTQSGDVFRLRGQGLPPAGGGSRGDLYATVRLETPTWLTGPEQDAIRAAFDSLDPGRFPKIQAFSRHVQALKK